MSYGRYPYYIWSDGEYLYFDLVKVPEEKINAFLYKILLTHNREELKRRVKIGKMLWVENEENLKQLEQKEDKYIKNLLE